MSLKQSSRLIHLIFKFLVLILSIIKTTQIYGQHKNLLTETGELIYCMDSAEFKISNVYLGLSKKDVFTILGKPDSIRNEYYFYQGLKIDFNKKDEVCRIFATSEKFRTPSGIHTGLLRIELFKILGLKSNIIPSIKFENHFVNCKNNSVFYIFYNESNDMKVIGIEIIGDEST